MSRLPPASRRELFALVVFLLALLLLVSAGRGWLSPLSRLPSEPLYEGYYTGKPGVHLLKVPFVKQKPWYCSEASASMVLQYYGFNVTQEEVHRQGFDRFENMLPFLQRYVEAKYVENCSLEEVKAQIDGGNPVILRLLLSGYRHSVVVVGYDKDHLYIHDPAQGAYLKANPKILLKAWEPTGRLAIFLKEKG